MYVTEKHQPNQKPDSFFYNHLIILLTRIFYINKISVQFLNGIMNENVIVEEYEFDKPLIRKIDFIVDICFRDCHNEFFHTFDHICVHDINFTDFDNIETVNLTFSDKNMELYELIKKLTVLKINN